MSMTLFFTNFFPQVTAGKQEALWPKMPRLGPLFDPKNPPEKVYLRGHYLQGLAVIRFLYF